MPAWALCPPIARRLESLRSRDLLEIGAWWPPHRGRRGVDGGVPRPAGVEVSAAALCPHEEQDALDATLPRTLIRAGVVNVHERGVRNR